MNMFEGLLDLSPPVAPQSSNTQHLWATIVSTSPILIRMDGDDAPLAVSPIPLMDERTLTNGMRVLVLYKGKSIYILGPDNPAVYTELLSLRSGLNSQGSRLNNVEDLTRHVSENTSNGRVYFGGVGGESGATNGIYLGMDHTAVDRESALWLKLGSNSFNSMNVTADGGFNMPKIPYAMAAGTASLTTSGSGQTISFPSGRFNAVPRIALVVTSTTNNTVSVAWFGTKSTTGISLATIFTLGGARIAGTVEWLAVQMTTGAGSG